MSDIKISLDSSGFPESVSVVRVDGVIDTMTATELEKVMNSLLEQEKYRIIVDLGGVDYISSAGWGIFISNIREIRQNSGDIKLARMIPNVYEIFELLEFDSILRAFDSIEKAKGDFRGAGKEVSEAHGKIEIPSGFTGSGGTTAAAASSQGKVSVQTVSDEKSDQEPSVRGKEISVGEPENIVLELITKDPFYTISEIKKELAKKNPRLSVGWWKIWSILRRNGLLRKKNRFRRARSKAGDM
jgi:anti-sigma B factor antagonist